MRVTQSMLTSNNLKYISQSYDRLEDIQNQLVTGKKITRPSQDPVIAMKGMRYRTQVVEVEQFQRNLSEVYSWMENADASLDQTTNALQRMRELTIQASNDTYGDEERKNIAAEITQIREHIINLGNTKVNNKYIFNGTSTSNQPIDLNVKIQDMEKFPEDFKILYNDQLFQYKSGQLKDDDLVFTNENGDEINVNSDETITSQIPNFSPGEIEMLKFSSNQQDVEMEVLKGVKITVNTNPTNVFNVEMFKDFGNLITDLEDATVQGQDLSKYIEQIDKHMNNIITERSELGARLNRAEMMEERVNKQEIVAKRQLSANEDVDFERAVTDLKTQESVHRAALAAGARIIQPTLLDFLR